MSNLRQFCVGIRLSIILVLPFPASAAAAAVDLAVSATTPSAGGLNAVAPGDSVQFQVGVVVDPAGAGGNAGLSALIYNVISTEAADHGLFLAPMTDAASGFSSGAPPTAAEVSDAFYNTGPPETCPNYAGGWGVSRLGLLGCGSAAVLPGLVRSAGIGIDPGWDADVSTCAGLQPQARLGIGHGTYTFPADDPLVGGQVGGFGQDLNNAPGIIPGDGTWLVQEGTIDTTGWPHRRYTMQLTPTSAFLFDGSLDYALDHPGDFMVSAQGDTQGTSFDFIVRTTTDCNGNSIHDDIDIAMGTSNDCNDSGIPDLCDLTSGLSQDANGNDIPDECDRTACVCGDLSANGSTNFQDFATFALCFNLSAPGASCTPERFVCSDLTADNVVNLNDFATFALLIGLPPAGNPPFCLDLDRDGFNGRGTALDCDDTNSLINPGANELCYNSLDDDCDGDTDASDTDCIGCPFPCGNLDGIGGVDILDFVTFAGCFNTSPYASQGCFCSDMNGDALIDLADYATFAAVYAGSSTNSVPNCP